MVKDNRVRKSSSKDHSKRISTSTRSGPVVDTLLDADDQNSVLSSNYNISLDDSSSIHSSDYSQSSSDGKSALKDDSTIEESLLSRLSQELLETIRRSSGSERIPKNNTSSTGSSSSSSGSPWVDDDSSDDDSSALSVASSPIPQPLDRHKFDAARKRMIEQQQQQRHQRRLPPQRLKKQMDATKTIPSKTRSPRDASSSASLQTGMHPSKPIDVTGAKDYTLPTSHRILEQVRQARLAKAAAITAVAVQAVDSKQNRSSSGRNEAEFPKAVRPRTATPQKPMARIVGIVPDHHEMTMQQATNKSQRHDHPPKRVAVKHTVSQIVVPVAPPPVTCIRGITGMMDLDTLSSIGGTIGDYNPSFHKQQRPRPIQTDIQRDRWDIERGNSSHPPRNQQQPHHTAHPTQTKTKMMDSTNSSSTNSSNVGGWISRRSDMELCLLGLVVSSLVTLAVLITLMIVGPDL